MKLTMVTTDHQRGGILLAFVNYLESALRLGHQVVVMVPHDAGDLVAEIGARQLNGFELVRLGEGEILRMRGLRRLPRRLRAAMDGSRVVVVHNNFLCAPFAATGVPVIAVCHTDRWSHLNAATRIVFLSKTTAAKFVTEGAADVTRASQVCVIPHYFDATELTNSYPQGRSDRFTVCAAGRFVENKGFRDFIAAAGVIRSQGGDVRFLLAGEGEEERTLRKQSRRLGDVVEFLGWRDIHELGWMSHLFCLTSDHEPFGYVICEMMDIGLPCISTRTSGPLEILDGERAGVFYPMGDSAALAAEIMRFAASPERRADYSARVFSRIREADFSRPLFLERLSAVIQTAAR